MIRLAVLPLACLVSAALLLAPSTARAQINEDWAVFPDSETTAECGVVNASNAELVVLFEDGVMATVGGVILTDLVVDLDSPAWPVTFEGAPAGFLAFATDGDGLPALFWFTLGGTIVGIDTFDAEPFDSGLFPEERINTGCDACELITSPLCEVDDDPDDDFPDFPDLPLLCGAGAPMSAALGMVSLGLLGFSRRRR